jgi:hypothetical protein
MRKNPLFIIRRAVSQYLEDPKYSMHEAEIKGINEDEWNVLHPGSWYMAPTIYLKNKLQEPPRWIRMMFHHDNIVINRSDRPHVSEATVVKCDRDLRDPLFDPQEVVDEIIAAVDAELKRALDHKWS